MMDQQLQDALQKAIPYMAYRLIFNYSIDAQPIENLFMFLSKRNIPYLLYKEHSPKTVEEYLINNFDFVDYRKLQWNINYWGPAIWDFLHKLSLYFNVEQNQKHLFDFLIMNLNFILPCEICVGHFLAARDSGQMQNIFENLNTNPVRAVFDLHNLVSARVHPERPPFSEDDFARKYKPF